MFEIRIEDQRLNAYRVIKGHTKYDVEAKAAAQIAIWNERALRNQVRAEAQARRDAITFGHGQGADEAESLTEQVQAKIASFEQLMSNLLKQPVPTWSTFQHHERFPEKKPTSTKSFDVPLAPLVTSFQPTFTFLDKVMKSRRTAKEKQAADEYETALAKWQQTKANIERAQSEEHERQATLEKEWQGRKDQFLALQRAENDSLTALESKYQAGDADAIKFLLDEVLSRTDLPDDFPQEWESSFIADNHTFVVDFELPDQTILPEYKEARYVKTKSEITFKPVTESWKKSTYDAMLYQGALGILHRLYYADSEAKVLSIVFNGWVRSVDRSTGADTHACILSLQAGRDEFLPLDLTRVDPKACFRSLKGVASSRLSDLAPIKPIQRISKEDVRFVDGYEVIDGLDDRTNLAAMEWQDFENLIREVFEKEFARNGGEVKITRASRDGGVDAVVFDSDPIRGGKIVIQAKRYTNTVGVSAVRDLFGTVQHEGAMKGILVTTANYGPDAYEFAKDKPLTLISGGELLSMLESHGHAAKINVAEARAAR